MKNGKHPRTLNEAFGPHTSDKIDEPVTPYDWQDKVVIVAGYLTVIFLICIATFDI